jgi:predicted acetyltransferase
LERRGKTRLVTSEEARALFPPVYDAVWRERSGMFSRTPEWWELRTLRMPEEEAATPKRFVVLELDGTPQAYGIYRSYPKFEDAVSKGRLEVLEAFGTTPQATAEIWRFLLDIDWSATVDMELLPPDHPLFMLLAHPRRTRYRMYDGLWVPSSTSAPRSRAVSTRPRGASCSMSAMPSARGTRAAGSSRTEPRHAPKRRRSLHST